MTASLDRRQLFGPERLGQSAGQALAGLDTDLLDEKGGFERSSLLSVSRRAMACLFEVLLPATIPDAFDAAHAVLDQIDELESQITVYRDSSEVSRLNELAPFGPVPVEENLFELLALSARLSLETEGAFDITAGALSKAWGFFRGPRRVPSEPDLAAARSRVGMKHVLVDEENKTVRYLIAGLEINLGSIGKGYALDRIAAEQRTRWRIDSGLLHGGYSSVYAMGTPPHDRRGWTVGICDPGDSGYRVAEVRLKDRALGTSAATFQHLEHQGRKLGHILDPRTGWPAEGMLSALVVAPTAAEADALATAFFILGVDKARSYCDRYSDIGAVLIPQPPPGETIRIIRLGRIDAEIYPQPVRLRRDSPCDYDDE